MYIFRINVKLYLFLYFFGIVVGYSSLENLQINLVICSLSRIFASVMKQTEHQILISLASNEQQEAHLAAAREQLTQLLTEVHFTSAIWTVPIGHSNAPANNVQSNMYFNQLCQGTTALGEGLLCEVLKEIEKRLGRTRNEDGIVAIDLDLLAYDGRRYHLRDWERSYVKDLLGEFGINN